MNADILVVRREPLSLDEVVRAIGHGSLAGEVGKDPEAGALVTFSGIVREKEGEATLTHLHYEHYERMAEKEIAKLFESAREKWPVHRLAIFHRTGLVAVGEASVIVAVSAGHRAEAFEAARFLIDELKKSVPIWKNLF